MKCDGVKQISDQNWTEKLSGKMSDKNWKNIGIQKTIGSDFFLSEQRRRNIET